MKHLIVVFTILVWINQPSYGYVDPGSGHLLWQALLAGFFGGFFYIKRFFTLPLFRRSRDYNDGE